MILAGYAIEVTSWENDGDFYNTKRIQGLTLNAVTWLVELAKLIQARNRENRQDDLTLEEAEDWFTNIRAKLGCTYDLEEHSLEDIYDHISDLVYEMMGGSEYGMRVLESYKVYFFEQNQVEVEI
jgi:hypothetical protein